MVDKFVVPGDVLGESSCFTSGPGTYSKDSFIRASVPGLVKSDCEVLRVERTPNNQHVVVPNPRSVVIGRVLSVTHSFAQVNILSVNDSVLVQSLKGLIMKEDIRATERDSVDVFNSFRPRDIVRARVIGFGEAQSYLLTTAENELGVILAKTVNNEETIPVSWTECQGVITGKREKRKMAKIFQAINNE